MRQEPTPPENRTDPAPAEASEPAAPKRPGCLSRLFGAALAALGLAPLLLLVLWITKAAHPF